MRRAREEAEKKAAEAARAPSQPSEPQSAPKPESAPEPAAQAAPEPPKAPEPAPEPEPVQDPVETLRSRWSAIRDEVARQNKVAAIMLAEARVLGLKDDTLVLGHNTGALAERLNAESNNAVIAKVVSEEARRELQVHCVIGTDPAAAGFSPVQKKETWNPQSQAPAPRETAGADTGSAGSADAPEEPESPAPAETPADPPTTSSWGKPRALGGDASPAPAPAPAKPAQTPPTPTPPAAENKPSWQRIAERGRANAARQAAERAARPSFDDGVPLPPEPMDDHEAPPEEPAPAPAPEPQPAAATVTAATSQSEEEEEMLQAAQEPGNFDRRDATTIAVELLEQELGARRL